MTVLFQFLRECHTVFHSRSSIQIPLTMHLCSIFPALSSSSYFLIMTTLAGVEWYCGFTHISFSAVEYLFLLAMCIPSLKKSLFKSFAHCLTGIFFLLLYELLYILNLNCLSSIRLQKFFPFMLLYTLDCFFCCVGACQLAVILLVYFDLIVHSTSYLYLQLYIYQKIITSIYIYRLYLHIFN